ncbi:acyl carrier protein [Lentzea sp. JNUCC 0626]|uniref:acyl carrier protein n=1 Tax=Lentzea sp. JNUCC 0626 TaxID=3367513 RepID=UPI0037478D00
MTNSAVPSAAEVLEDIATMVTDLLDQYGLDDVEITADSRFHDDLGLESIDLVSLGAMIADRYGEHVNLAEFLADLKMDRVIGLRLGLLVDFVVSSLEKKASTPA